MKFFHRLAAWLARKSRTRQRRKLYRELIKIGHKREMHPERQGQYFAEVSSIIARLDSLALADDIAGVEARMKPAPLWPGLPAEGLRLRAAQEGGK
jgi:ribosomal protein S19E (S16A)